MFDCPNCGKQSKKLIGTKNGIFCLFCFEAPKYSQSPYLGMKTGPWGEMTKGKAWEIDSRIISRDDGKTVINRYTGKETQY